MSGWSSETQPVMRYFYSKPEEMYFTSEKDCRDGSACIELPEDLWKQRKANQERVQVSAALSVFINAQTKLKAIKDEADEAKLTLIELGFGSTDDFTPGTHKKTLEVSNPVDGVVSNLELKITVGTTIKVDTEALLLLKPSIPEADFKKLFTVDYKIDKKAYDNLPDQSKRFLSSAITVKNGSPAFSYVQTEQE